MYTIPAALIAEKNALGNSSPFLLLCEIQLTGVVTLRLVKNEANVTWDSQTWAAFPFDIDDMGEAGKGETPRVSLRVSNVSRAIQSYIEQYDGGVDSTVILRVVHADHLSSGDSDVFCRLDFTVTGCTANAKEVVFSLGASNPWNRRIPLGRVRKNFCRWKFKGNECSYGGLETTCDKTLTRCRALGISRRFGGFPGVGLSGVRLYV
jgi:lambda family phage minor tail protein L